MYLACQDNLKGNHKHVCQARAGLVYLALAVGMHWIAVFRMLNDGSFYNIHKNFLHPK